jgi:phosphoserine/homoserine phosphotransferase
MPPLVVCLDLEGVLIPEVWIAFAEKTGIDALRRTTRDEPDYDKLMRGRLEILDEHGFKLSDIDEVIGTMEPLPGAKDFLDETDYRLRIPDGKRKAVAGLKNLGFRVHAAGDSYNDTTMLKEADRGILFRCPDNVAEEFPQFQRTEAYSELLPALLD